MPGQVQDVLTNVDGSYQLKKIPAGRYKLMIDPITREYRWPAEIQFYPSKSNVEDAEVLELSEGQKIAGMDFKVPDLAERSIQVRVTMPNGSPVQNASVCIAYEKTGDYEPLQAKHCPRETNQEGVAAIHVYGNSRVRVFANQLVYRDKAWSEYRSQPAESEAKKIPTKIELVLTSQKPWVP